MTGRSLTEVGTSAGRALVDLARPGRTGPIRPGSGRPGSGRAPGPRFLLALTHGAGGSVSAPDLLAARDAALTAGGAVALVTQPYQVKGARAPGSAARQDEAWCEIIAALRGGPRRMPAGDGQENIRAVAQFYEELLSPGRTPAAQR